MRALVGCAVGNRGCEEAVRARPPFFFFGGLGEGMINRTAAASYCGRDRGSAVQVALVCVAIQSKGPLTSR